MFAGDFSMVSVKVFNFSDRALKDSDRAVGMESIPLVSKAIRINEILKSLISRAG